MRKTLRVFKKRKERKKGKGGGEKGPSPTCFPFAQAPASHCTVGISLVTAREAPVGRHQDRGWLLGCWGLEAMRRMLEDGVKGAGQEQS